MPHKGVIVNIRASAFSQIRLLDPAESGKLEQCPSKVTDYNDFIKLIEI